nr:RNA-directed DNA polymerase, eukaryota, reverse transcriptase zinc-binding domain protein [Tanacetum cinerariifolium]
MEAVWIRKFVGDLRVMPSINKPINMYCDNFAAIIFANEPEIMKGARHFLRRYHYIREQVETGEIKLIKVYTDDNLADPFTKALPRGMVIDHAKGVGLQLTSSFMHTSLFARLVFRSASERRHCEKEDFMTLVHYISLIGSMYKIISKILANRLVVVLGGLVNEIQSAFVADKQILDGLFILNELVQWCKKKKKQSLVFKVDFEKAYDSSSRGSVIVNGSPTEEFQFYKGLKQVDVGLFKGIELAHSLNLSYMFYADDAIFMGQWSESNIDTIVKVLDCFNRASSLRINMTKSKLLGISMEDDEVKQSTAKIGCNTLKTPFSYLGSKVGGCMYRIQSWNETIERMAFPKNVLHRMESIRSYFFNGAELSSKKYVLVKWKHALASKEKGGLGVSSLFVLNRALMFKWVWRFITQGSSLWARVIKVLHGYDGKIGQKVKSCYPALWLDIIHEVEMFKSRSIDLVSLIHSNLGNGTNGSFWEVAWRGGLPFKSLFPRLYEVETQKKIDVASKLSHSGLDVLFRRPPRGGVKIQQFEHMKEKYSGLVNEIQSAFVVDKQLLNGSFILNELVQWCKKKKKQSLVFKVDFKKAYDSARWDHLDEIRRTFGFGEKWCMWIQSCLRSSRGSGSKVGGCMSRIQSWNEMIKTMACRLSKCKLKTFSIGGRLTLLKSVLGSMPIYHMSLFKVLKKVLHHKGGLGVSSLFAINRALMFKWVWRFITQGSSLWARVIKALHGYDGKIGQNVKSCYPSLWLDIIHEVEMFKSRGIDFVSLIHSNLIDVASKLSHSCLDVLFHRPPRGGVEIQQFEHMKEKVEGCILADMMDRWFWALEGLGEFTIMSVRKLIQDFMLTKVSSKTRWIKGVPIKVNVHAWKVKLDGLPTRLNISHRGIDIESILCPMCGKAVESTSHIFCTCQMSKEILRKISRW